MREKLWSCTEVAVPPCYSSKDLTNLDKAIFLDHVHPVWKVKRNCLNDLLLFWNNRRCYLHNPPAFFHSPWPSRLQRHCCHSYWKVFRHLSPENFRLLWMVRIAQMPWISHFWRAQVTWHFDKSQFSYNFYESLLLLLWIWSGSSVISGKTTNKTRWTFGYLRPFVFKSERKYGSVCDKHIKTHLYCKRPGESVMQDATFGK